MAIGSDERQQSTESRLRLLLQLHTERVVNTLQGSWVNFVDTHRAQAHNAVAARVLLPVLFDFHHLVPNESGADLSPTAATRAGHASGINTTVSRQEFFDTVVTNVLGLLDVAKLTADSCFLSRTPVFAAPEAISGGQRLDAVVRDRLTVAKLVQHAWRDRATKVKLTASSASSASLVSETTVDTAALLRGPRHPAADADRQVVGGTQPTTVRLHLDDLVWIARDRVRPAGRTAGLQVRR
jgi:hypothetical protein